MHAFQTAYYGNLVHIVLTCSKICKLYSLIFFQCKFDPLACCFNHAKSFSVAWQVLACQLKCHTHKHYLTTQQFNNQLCLNISVICAQVQKVSTHLSQWTSDNKKCTCQFYSWRNRSFLCFLSKTSNCYSEKKKKSFLFYATLLRDPCHSKCQFSALQLLK